MNDRELTDAELEQISAGKTRPTAKKPTTTPPRVVFLAPAPVAMPKVAKK